MKITRALCIALLLTSTPLAAAQDYSFSVPEMLLSVYVNPDASITMEYDIVFACSPGAHPIDVVDVGLPHKAYDIGDMSAAVNGVSVHDIATSTYIDTGVEVKLGSQAISGGQRGRFTFKCTMPDLVYQDTTDKDYASLRITPTWFDGSLLQGTTELGVVVYLPKDIKPEEILHQGQEFSAKEELEDYTFAAWRMPVVRVDGPHLVGLSFPKRNMERVVKMTILGLFMKWWREHPNARFVWAAVVFILFGIMFFRATQGTGISLFVVLVAGASILFVASPVAELLALPALLPMWYLSERLLKRRRGQYLPAIASVEGGGVKRGLTAPEAAIVLEMPLGRVLTLVMFGLLRKGILRQIAADPLRVELAPEYAGKTRAERRKAARQLGAVHHGYEQPFIEAIERNPGVAVDQIDFTEAMRECIERTAARMNGFDVEQTCDYYRYVVKRAWAEASTIGGLEQRTKYTDDNLLWMMADEEYDDRFEGWRHRGYYYRPPWRTIGPRAPAAPAPATDVPAAVGGRTSLQDVAASFAGWTENLTGRLGSKMNLTSVGTEARGIVDLSGVDKVTLDVLNNLAESSGSGGGGGGCACAGCACACACAGGGR